MVNRYVALRAMLAARGRDTERVDAGIDACRSPRWRETVAATLAARKLRQQTTNESDQALARWLPMPRAERVHGAGELRSWLRARLREIRAVRCKRGNVEYHVRTTSASRGKWGGYINVRLWECDVGGHAYRELDSRERIFGGQMARSQGAKALVALEEKARKLRAEASARSAVPSVCARAINRWVKYGAEYHARLVEANPTTTKGERRP